MNVDPARLFVWTGLLWHGLLRAYWVSLVVRITVELGLPSLQLVLLGTAMELALLLAEIPTGVVADTFSRKWSVVIGFVGVGVAQIGAGLVESFGLLVLTQVAWGISYTFRSGAETAWITDELGGPEKVEGILLRRARLQLVVSIFSVLGGAILARATSLSTSVVLTGIVMIVGGAALAVVMPENGFVRPVLVPVASGEATGAGPPTLVGLFSQHLKAATASFRRTLVAGAAATRSSRPLMTLAAVLIVAGLAGEAVDRLDIRRLDQLGLSADLDEIIVVAIIAMAQSALGALVLWWSQARLTGRQVAPGMAVLLAVSALGIATLGLVAILPIAIVGLVGQGGLRIAAQPLTTTWTNAHAPSEVRATVHSFIEQASSVGEISGGVILGAVAAASTVPTAMTISAALLVIAAAVASTGRRAWT